MVDIKEQSPLALAFVGDGVYSLLIREHLVTDKRHPVNKLHKMAVEYVSAKGQFLALELIGDILTEDEANIIRRGKNTSKASVAKHASVEEYRASTGCECLLGYMR
ncbi:MAG: ribonuclease III domain-containing protein [Oscillospiraceae bacterium]